MAKFSRKQARQEFEDYSDNVTEDDVSSTLENEDEILRKTRGPLKKFAQTMKILFSMVKDYANGSYKEIPWTTIAAIVVALIYVFSPIDLIPDFIPGIGLLDDAAVMSVCLAAIAKDLVKYKKWKEI
jgi:uncharacterized membrane protein YkvA (DUF1232 family)